MLTSLSILMLLVQNVVILNSEKSPQLNEVFAKLAQLKKARPGLAISLYGYNQWFVYQDYNLDQYFKYNTYIPSTYIIIRLRIRQRS